MHWEKEMVRLSQLQVYVLMLVTGFELHRLTWSNNSALPADPGRRPGPQIQSDGYPSFGKADMAHGSHIVGGKAFTEEFVFLPSITRKQGSYFMQDSNYTSCACEVANVDLL